MTDDKLREASERVAKRWLGWTPAAGAYREDGSLYQVVAWHTSDGEIRTADQLASPWGMGLLLDAIEKRTWNNQEDAHRSHRIEVEYQSYITHPEANRVHLFTLWQYPYRELQLGYAVDKNRYAALIMALDKVEALDAER